VRLCGLATCNVLLLLAVTTGCFRARSAANAEVSPACSWVSYDSSRMQVRRATERELGQIDSATTSMVVRLVRARPPDGSRGVVILLTGGKPIVSEPDSFGYLRVSSIPVGRIEVRARMLAHEGLRDTVWLRRGFVDTVVARPRRAHICLDRLSVSTEPRRGGGA
jgi:hypothetical protein